jgi:hypothetical protein
MKTLEVKKGTIKFDDEDYPLVAEHTWFIENTGYAVTNVPFHDPAGKRRQTRLYLQRLLMGEPPEGHLIKFLDGDRANCQRDNLEFQLHRDVRQSADDWKSKNMGHCRPINVNRDPVTNQWKKIGE